MNRHRFDPWSFLLGALLAAFALIVLVGGVDVTEWNLSWVWPVPFILAGVLMLLSARRRSPEELPSAPTPAGDEHTDPIEPLPLPEE
jgi:hypothetical protein